MTQIQAHTPSILVVDDIPANVDVLVEHYRHENIQLSIALSGKDALRLANEFQPDLILLDIMMPDMNGYEVCRQLKCNPRTKHIPVIFLTAVNDTVEEEKGLALGAVDYIRKPFVLPILKARVRTHLELKRKTDLLSELANVDGLTGIYNRRYFDDTLIKEWNRCQRAQSPVSVIMIDIDYFKFYNDHYGHGAGDVCLKKVAHAMQQSAQRPGDLLARYGGEEFILLLPAIDQHGASQVAEAILASVSNLNIAHAKSPTANIVTISLGLASVSQANNNAFEALIKQSDVNLYTAKKSGRNQYHAS